jgi:hypothetical protein
MRGLDVGDKAERVYSYHKNTIHGFSELLGAAGFDNPEQLRPHHIHRRLDFRTTMHYGQLFDYIEHGSLIALDRDAAVEKLDRTAVLPGDWSMQWDMARADQF